MKKSSVIAVAILALTIVFSTVSFSQHTGMNGKMGMKHGMGMRKGMGNGYQMFLKKLNLTDQQKEKIADLRLAFQKNMIDLKANLAKDKLALKELRVKNDFTRSDVLGAVENINKAKNDISLAVANHMLDVYGILTPEQQKIAKEGVFKFWGKMHPMKQGFRDKCMKMK
ncbi:MAG: Spy/CpxP family protein refolding chaperone [Ignavibacteriaceae bacterium]